MNNTEIRAEEQRAIYLEESGNKIGALEIWLRLARTKPMAGFFCHAGGVLQDLGRLSEAELAFRSACELDPGMVLASIGLASVQIDGKQFAEALETLDAVIAHDENALAYGIRGSALMSLGRYEDALHSLRRAVVLDPSYDEAFYNMGYLLRDADQAEARAAFAKAIELDKNYANAHRELGWLLRRANQFDPAEAHLRRATELNPADAWAWVYLGNLLWAEGQFPSAESSFKQAYSASPDEWYPNWALATFFESGGRLEKAARYYHQALLASPDEPVVLFNYGRFLLKQGDGEAAQKFLKRANELDPDNARARKLLDDMGKSGKSETA